MSATVVLLLTKCTASITKSLVPLVLAERVQHQQSAEQNVIPSATLEQFEETYAASFEWAFASTLVVINLVNLFYARAPTRLACVSACCIQLVTSMLLVNAVFLPSHLQSPAMLTLLHALHLLSLSIINIASTAWSIQSGVPQSRAKLFGTALVALLQIMVLVVPMASNPVVFGAVSLLASSLLVYLFVSDRESASALALLQPAAATSSDTSATDNPQSDEHHLQHQHEQHRVSSSSATSSSSTMLVSPMAATFFLVICIVGLNGEQLLDASASVKIRDVHFAGSRGPAILKQLITLVAALMAIGSTSSPSSSWSLASLLSSPVALIVAWGVAQSIRVLFLDSMLTYDTLGIVVFLLILDKYTGSLGEVAFEQALLNYLRTHEIAPQRKHDRPLSFAAPMLWLMSAYALIEDLMQSMTRRIVRLGRKASPGQWPFIFRENRNLVVAMLVVCCVSFVVRYAKKPPRAGKRLNSNKVA